MTLKDQFYYWATTAGKYIIIVTEIIVIACFAARIIIDTRLQMVRTAVINDISNINQIYSKALEVKVYQGRIADQTVIMKSQYLNSDIMSHTLNIITTTSNRLTISTIAVTEPRISIIGTINGAGTAENNIIQSLGNTFKSDNLYKDVVLSTVNNNSQSISFTLSMNISR